MMTATYWLIIAVFTTKNYNLNILAWILFRVDGIRIWNIIFQNEIPCVPDLICTLYHKQRFYYRGDEVVTKVYSFLDFLSNYGIWNG